MDAVIFDMDGVISDTQRLHSEVESGLLRAWGIDIDPDDLTRRYAGMADRDFLPAVLGRPVNAAEFARWTRDKWGTMAERAPGRIVPMDGALELIALLGARGVPIAVASSSPMSFIDQVLSELGVGDAFAARATGEEVPRGKPAPDVFLLAARRLGVAPERCTVIEDAVAGMTAARAAGMRCVALVDDPTRPLPADVAVRSLREAVAEPERILGLR
ncbi:MAG TPA: HAD family phosphatase [Longimicrobium sp.]|jgi:HAD superfamily hydrolase (TIGR01509 family)|uniref:HAD family hydrolase n=1 Tax=Longimicrobium sp. TaxID=2029185 RepID=UPI002ED97191